jgi:hypothetical protein
MPVKSHVTKVSPSPALTTEPEDSLVVGPTDPAPVGPGGVGCVWSASASQVLGPVRGLVDQ